MMNLKEAQKYNSAVPKSVSLFGGLPLRLKIRQAYLYHGELFFDCVMGNEYLLFREHELMDFSEEE
jgi:hypothetical protein